MTTTSFDRRRYGVIETRFHPRGQVAMYVLSIGGETWAQVEWSPSRRTWCIPDASMPTPEEAEAQLRQRLAAEHGALPARTDDLRIANIAAQLEEIEQQHIERHWIEQQRQGTFDVANTAALFDHPRRTGDDGAKDAAWEEISAGDLFVDALEDGKH